MGVTCSIPLRVSLIASLLLNNQESHFHWPRSSTKWPQAVLRTLAEREVIHLLLSQTRQGGGADGASAARQQGEIELLLTQRSIAYFKSVASPQLCSSVWPCSNYSVANWWHRVTGQGPSVSIKSHLILSSLRTQQRAAPIEYRDGSTRWWLLRWIPCQLTNLIHIYCSQKRLKEESTSTFCLSTS